MTKTRILLIALLAFALVATLTGTSAARPTPADSCAIAKLHATARLLDGRLRCAGRAARTGVGFDAGCDAKAEDRFFGAFSRINGRGGCVFTADVVAVFALTDDLVFELDSALRPTLGANRCAAGKLVALAQRAFAELGCIARAVAGKEANDACVARVSGAFAKRLVKAERRGPCLTTGDGPTLEASLVPFSLFIQTIFGTSPLPSDLSATVDGAAIDLAWTPPDPSSGDTDVKILRRLNTPPTGPDDPQATQVFFGTATSTTDDLTALLPDTPTVPRTYHYAAFGCTGAGACEPQGTNASVTPTIVQALRAGGYVVSWRHGAADICVDHTDLGTASTTAVPNWWKSCDANCATTATARQLNASGAADATTIGNAFDTLGIPVGRVVSSEFCRTVTTAQLMSFGPAIEQRQDITFFVYDEANRCQHVQALLAEAPAAGTNTAIIGHAGFVCANLDQLAMGEGAIFKPDGSGGSTFIARVLPAAWATLP